MLADVLMGEPEQFTFAGWSDATVYAYVVKPYDAQEILDAVDRAYGLAADPEPRETIVLDLDDPLEVVWVEMGSEDDGRPLRRVEARRYVEDVQYYAADACRADVEYLYQVLEAVIKADMSISVAGTLETASVSMPRPANRAAELASAPQDLPSSYKRPACQTIRSAASSAIQLCASGCWIDWFWPIGRPNTTRFISVKTIWPDCI